MYLWLWFDVGIKRYTTSKGDKQEGIRLWFDVGIKRYTTDNIITMAESSCGLM